MTFQADYHFFLKGLFFAACVVVLMTLFRPSMVFAEVGTPSDAEVSDRAYQDAYQDAYEDAYDMFMDDMYSMYADLGEEEAVLADLGMVLSECRDFLESCMYLSIVGVVLLAVLIGCLCSSIFSHFLRWTR